MEQRNQECIYEINIYDIWKMIVKRRRIVIGLFFIVIISTAIANMFMPKIYRGQVTLNVIDNSSLTAIENSKRYLLIDKKADDAQEIVNNVGSIGDEKKKLIFPGAYKSVKSAKLRALKETKEIAVTIDAKSTDVIPVAVSELVDFLNKMESVKTGLKEEREALMKRFIELTNLQKTGQDSLIVYNRQVREGKIDLGYNPLALGKDVADIKNEKLAMENALSRLKNGRIQMVTSPSISNKPVSPKILHNVFVAGILSLLVGIALALLIEYISKIKKTATVSSNN